MRYVIDSSVALKWKIREADTDIAVRLLDEARQGLHEFLAPDVFPVEIAHAITRAERQKRITPSAGELALAAILFDLPTIHPS